MRSLQKARDKVIRKLDAFMDKEPAELSFILLDFIESEINRYSTRWI